MTFQASDGALRWAKTERVLCTWCVIDLVASCLEQKTVHDMGHVARLAAAAFRCSAMTRVPLHVAPELLMTLQAHFIWIRGELERRVVFLLAGQVWIVAASTLRLSLPEARRSHERFHDKRGLAKSPVL